MAECRHVGSRPNADISIRVIFLEHAGMTPQIQLLTPELLPLLQEHLARHQAESGGQNAHFLPYATDGSEQTNGLDVEGLKRLLDERDWQRWYIAVVENRIVGHVVLKSDRLKAGLHRCELGIGIEFNYRSNGLGRQLMKTAINFALDSDGLSWVDLRVFGHNIAARKLYQALGFSEIGTYVDRFRIDGESIDAIMMTLKVS